MSEARPPQPVGNTTALLTVFGVYVFLNMVCVLGPLGLPAGPALFLLALLAFSFVGPPVGILALVVVQLCFKPRAFHWVLAAILALAMLAVAGVNFYVMLVASLAV